MTEDDCAGKSYIVVPNIPPIEEYGFAVGDPGMTELDYRSIGKLDWLRALPAVSLPQAMPDGMLAGCASGFDPAQRAMLGGLDEILQKTHAGGFPVELVFDQLLL
jgi:hypothetical protein